MIVLAVIVLVVAAVTTLAAAVIAAIDGHWFVAVVSWLAACICFYGAVTILTMEDREARSACRDAGGVVVKIHHGDDLCLSPSATIVP